MEGENPVCDGGRRAKVKREEDEAPVVGTCSYQICKSILSLTERNRQEPVDTPYTGRLIPLHKVLPLKLINLTQQQS